MGYTLPDPQLQVPYPGHDFSMDASGQNYASWASFDHTWAANHSAYALPSPVYSYDPARMSTPGTMEFADPMLAAYPPSYPQDPAMLSSPMYPTSETLPGFAPPPSQEEFYPDASQTYSFCHVSYPTTVPFENSGPQPTEQ
uniref:Colorectal cancer associated 2 n=1 Tax=Steinernema glaseri TaxID=37863 RepID=A0A1I7ZXE0_9BILA